jgi:hypothetical protein
MTNTKKLEAGKTYKSEWMAMGHPRSATFRVLKIARSGNAVGLYTLDGKTGQCSIKPESFCMYVEI